jgi:hypothetical protein
MFKQILKNLTIFLFSCGLFFQKFYAAQPIITIYNPEKLNYITEKPFFSLKESTAPPQVVTALQTAASTDEFSDLDLDISTPLLFSDEPVIPLYNAPSFTAASIGSLTPPGDVRVVRLCRDFAKVEVCEDQAGWILRRNIQTAAFDKKYQERFDRLIDCLPTIDPLEEIIPVSPNNEGISIPPSPAETITNNLEEEPEDEKK